MDVERKTTITAGMNNQPMVEGLRQIGDEAQKAATRVTQSAEQISRKLQDIPRGFQALQKQFIDGYGDMLKYSQGWQTVQQTMGKGGDALKNSQTILTSLATQFGLTAAAAEDAAKRMADTSLSEQQRLQAEVDLLNQVREARKLAAAAQEDERLTALAAKYNPLLAAQRTYAEQIAEITLLQQKEKLSASEAEAAIARVTAARRDAAVAANEQQQALQKAHETANNQLMGIRDPAAAKSAEASAAVFTAGFDAEAKRIDELVTKYNPLLAAQRQHLANMAEIDEAMAKGVVVGTEIAAAQQREIERYNAQINAIRGVKDNYNQLRASVDAVYASSMKYADELERIDQLQAQGMAPAQADKLRADAQQRFAAANTPQLDTADKLRRQYDPLYAASMKYADGIEEINKRSAALNLTAAQTDKLLENHRLQYEASVAPLGRATNATHQYTGANGQLQFAMRQLNVQAVQTFSGFATGQPIMMTLVQQGHQVVDVMLSSGASFRQVAAEYGRMALALLTNPWVLLALAIGAVVVALGVMTYKAEEANRALKNLENQTRAVRDDFGPMSKQAELAAGHLAKTFAISFQEAFAATSTLAKTPQFVGTQEQMEDLVKTGEAMSQTFGGDLASNMQTLVKGMTHAGEVAKELLAKNVKGVTVEWVEMVRTIESQNPTKAFDILVDKINSVAEASTRNKTALQQEVEKFIQLVTGSTEGSWRTIGEAIAEGLVAPLLHKINELIEAWQNFVDKVTSFHKDWASGQIPILAGSGFEAPVMMNPPAQPSTVPPAQIQQFITEAAKSRNLQEDIFRKMIQVESQFNPNATGPETKYGRAMGLGQLLPGTARDMGVTAPYDPQQNLEGSAKYLRQLLDKYNQDYVKALAAYNWGPKNLDTYGLGKMPPETKKYVTDILGEAVVRQALEVAGAPSSGATTPTGSHGTTTTTTTAVDQATQAAADTLAARGRALQREMAIQIEGMKAAQEALAKTKPGTPEYAEASKNVDMIAEKMRRLTSDIMNNISEQEKLTRSLQDANRPLQEDAGAAREYAEIMEHFRQVARDTNGGVIDQTALLAALAAKHAALAAALKDTIHAMDQQTNAEKRLTEAHERGGQVLETASNVQRAMIEADKYAKAGTEEHKAIVVELTAAYERNSAAKRENAAADVIHQLDQENEQIELQTKLIGASTAEINRQTEALRLRQQFGLKPGDTPTPEQQKALDLSKQTADAKTNLERLKAAESEVQQFGERVFDGIGSAIEASFQKGANAAEIWKNEISNILNEIIKEFMKLAILNPLMNEIFGTNRPTLADAQKVMTGAGGSNGSGGGGLFGWLGSLFGGSNKAPSGNSGAPASGFAPTTDIFGKAVNLVGGQGFYEGGGLFGSLFGGGGGLSGGASVAPDMGGIYHSGGVVGMDGQPVRFLPPGTFNYAPHFASGLANDEFAAILHRSERVLTSAQNSRLESVLGRVANSDELVHHGRGAAPQVVFNISTPDADSFRSSQPQIAARAVTALNRTNQRMRT